jgi:hypothetical protein
MSEREIRTKRGNGPGSGSCGFAIYTTATPQPFPLQRQLQQ